MFHTCNLEVGLTPLFTWSYETLLQSRELLRPINDTDTSNMQIRMFTQGLGFYSVKSFH